MFRDVLRAFPEQSAGEAISVLGSMYLQPLSKEDHACATRALGHIAEYVRRWRCLLVPEVDFFLTQSYEKLHSRPYYDLDRFPDFKTCEGPNSKRCFYHSSHKRRRMWLETKEYFLEEIVLLREHLDLRLCGTAANQVAKRLGRLGGVSLHFAGYRSKFAQDGWNETPGTILDRKGYREVACEPGFLVEFAQVVVESNTNSV